MAWKAATFGPHWPTSRARAIWTLVVLLLALILSGIDRHILTLLVHPIEAELKISDTQISLLHGMAFILVHAAATIAVGWLADRRDRSRILFGGIALWSGMTALSGIARSFPMLAVLRGGVGIGEATVVPAGYSLVAGHFPPERRGIVTGVLSAATVAGAGLALLIGGLILALIGERPHMVPVLGTLAPWRLTLLILGLAGLPLALLVLTLRDPRNRLIPDTAADQQVAKGSPFLDHVRAHRATFFAVLGAGACNAMVGIGSAAWAPTLLIRRFGIAPAEAGYLIGAAVLIGGMTGALSATGISDRWVARRALGGRLRGHIPIMLLALAGIFLFAFGPSPRASALGYCVLSIGVNGVSAVSYAAIQDLAPPNARSRLLALMHLVAALAGYAIAPTLIALATDRIYGDPGALPAAILTFAVPLYVLGMILARRGYAAYSATYEALHPRACDRARDFSA